MTSDQRRAVILEAAREIFLQQSYSSATIREIADAVGVNQAVIYRHFRSKAELMEQSVIEPSADVRQRLFRAIAQLARAGLRGDDGGVRFLEEMCFSCTEDSFPVFSTLLYADPTFALEAIEPYWLRPLNDAVAEVLASPEGQLGQHDATDIKCLLVAIYGANLGWEFHKAFAGSDNDTDERRRQEIGSILSSGLLDDEQPASRGGRSGGRKRVARARKPELDGKVRIASPVPSSEPSDRNDVRAQILRAAQSLFIQQGWKRATVKDITALAGVVEPVLYRQFESKRDLFDAAMMEPLEEVIADWRNLVPLFEHAPNSASRLPLGVHVNLEFFSAMKRILPVLAVALFSDRETGSAFYREQLIPHLDRISSALEHTMSHEARKIAEPRTLMHMMFGMHMAAASLDASTEPLPGATVANVFSLIISFGIGSLSKGSSEGRSRHVKD